jgi:quercetin dioxygenase-like cupin family protein
MKQTNKALVGALVLAGAMGLASATPIVKLASPNLAVGEISTPVKSHGVASVNDPQNHNWFNTELTTDGPSTVTIQDGAYAAGGQNGWHSHPGLVIVTLLSGSIEWFNANCESKVYKAGDSWTEGSQLHSFRVLGTTGIHLMAVFVVAKDEAVRIDGQAPACAAGLGL